MNRNVDTATVGSGWTLGKTVRKFFIEAHPDFIKCDDGVNYRCRFSNLSTPQRKVIN